jgi:hypothetical protein
MAQEQLAQWLTEQCQLRGWAWSVASRKAGVSPNTISEIVGGTPVGPKRILPFSDLFNVPRDFLLRLAGLLPAEPEWAPPVIADEARVRSLVERMARLSPDAQDRVIEATLVLLEFAEAADHAQKSETEKTTIPATGETAA